MDDPSAKGGATQPEQRYARPGMADSELCIIIVERSGTAHAHLVSHEGVAQHPQYSNPNEAHYPGRPEDFLALPLSEMPYGFFVNGEGTACSIGQAPSALTYNPRTHTLCVPWTGSDGAAAQLFSPMLRSVAECMLFGATIAPPESFPLSSLKLPDAIRVANEYLRRKYECTEDGGVSLPSARHLLVESSLQLTRLDEGKVFVLTSGTRSDALETFHYTPEIEHWSVLERYGVVRLPCGLKTAEIDELGLAPHIWVSLGDLHHDGDRPDGVQSAHHLPVLFAQVRDALNQKRVVCRDTACRGDHLLARSCRREDGHIEI